MRKIVLIAVALLFLISFKPSYAQTTFPENAESGSSVVTATVGQFFLNVTGYQSPNASILIQTLNGLFLESTTADGAGYFRISEVNITKDFPGFCFEAVDFRRIGESRACIEINEVINENQTYEDIFLPPTIGLSKRVIATGENAEIFGYSMPSAQVEINYGDETITVQTDDTGYYEYVFEDPEAGTYAFTSEAVLGQERSIEPENRVVLRVITLEERMREDLTGFTEDVEERFPGFLFLAPFILVLIALLIALAWKTKPKFLHFVFDKFRKKHYMHHDYFLFKE